MEWASVHLPSLLCIGPIRVPVEALLAAKLRLAGDKLQLRCPHERILCLCHMQEGLTVHADSLQLHSAFLRFAQLGQPHLPRLRT